MFLLLVCSVSNAAGETCGPQRIALSFDDPPTADSVVMTGTERTERIVAALHNGRVEQAAFFAVSSRIDENSRRRLVDYAAAGHVIANHSHTHPNLHRIGPEAFLDDVLSADPILAELPGFRRFFRFPYLNEGHSLQERDSVRIGLRELGYQLGYVTVDNFDFYIDRLLREALERGHRVDLAAVSDLYVEMIIGAVRHYDAIACEWLGRSPRHVLLLHENDVAALFLPALIEALANEGWSIVTIEEAYDDPISAVVPDTLFLGQGQVAAIAAAAGAETDRLRHVGENTGVLDRAFEKALLRVDADEDRQ